MSEVERRLPHAALSPTGRLPKAEKIAALLKLDSIARTRLRLLEIGTGSGVIAHYFATRPEFLCEVDAVDVLDQRQVVEGYRYQTVTDMELPFGDGSFDIVISNHVIEHVGRADEQTRAPAGHCARTETRRCRLSGHPESLAAGRTTLSFDVPELAAQKLAQPLRPLAQGG